MCNLSNYRLMKAYNKTVNHIIDALVGQALGDKQEQMTKSIKKQQAVFTYYKKDWACNKA